MSGPLTAPDDEELACLGLEAQVGDEPWVRSVTLGGENRARVSLTWDAVASSAHVVWSQDGVVIAEISREMVDAVAVDARSDGHLVTITSHSEGLASRLTVTVTAEGVRLHDSLLRT